MRIALAALLVVLAGSAFEAVKADPYRWCAQYSGDLSASNCGFVTLEQCRATVSGVGGFCQPNPFYDGVPVGGKQPVRRPPRR